MSDELEEIFHGMLRRRREPQIFRLGDTVRILSGPLAAFTGRIEGINQSKRLLKVKVEIFGREQPVKLGYAEVEKVSSS
jgi:transcription antitermination factor NusG